MTTLLKNHIEKKINQSLSALETGGVLVSEEVKIQAEVQLVKKIS